MGIDRLFRRDYAGPVAAPTGLDPECLLASAIRCGFLVSDYWRDAQDYLLYCQSIRRPFVQVVKGRHVAIDMEPVGMILGPAALGRFGRAVGGKVASDRPNVALVSPWGRMDAARMRRLAWAVYDAACDLALDCDLLTIRLGWDRPGRGGEGECRGA